MTELFSGLYRYRQREKKESQEDWLTECLAAVLRALPKQEIATVLAQLTGQTRELILAAREELSIVTQVTIERGKDGSGRQRPDMLISVGGEPWLLFENKVGHSVDQVENDEGQIETQLHRYGEWLSRQSFSTQGLTPALIFITHQTSVPADFADPQSQHPAYRGLGRYCSTWGQVGRMLYAATSNLGEALHARALVKAYISYLEKHGMANDYPDYKDLAGVRMFIEKVDSFRELVNGMMQRLGGLAPFAGRVVWADAYSDEGTFASHRYLRAETRFNEDTYVETGIWFPDLAEGWYRKDIEDQAGNPVSPSAKVFLQLANSKDDALSQVLGVPGEGWLRLNSDFFIFRDFASFPSDPNERALSIFAWLDAECAKLKALLSA
ncbi:MAG TPA: hypothetical protein VIT45_04715 [Allosphingosinicella sp.]